MCRGGFFLTSLTGQRELSCIREFFYRRYLVLASKNIHYIQVLVSSPCMCVRACVHSLGGPSRVEGELGTGERSASHRESRLIG